MLKAKHQVAISLLTLVSAVGAGVIYASQVDPFEAEIWQILIFYGILFMAVGSASMLAGFGFRIFFWRSGIQYEYMRAARRQGVLFAVIIGVALWLQSQNIFSIWTGLLLFLVVSLIEYYAVAH